jgi:peptidyl-prolyl cis-trans isomerase C
VTVLYFIYLFIFIIKKESIMTILVNGYEITPAEIAAALPDFARAENPEQAATEALVMRRLLIQKSAELGLTGASDEASLDALLAQEIQVPQPPEDVCLKFYEDNPASFVMGETVSASHILFPTQDVDEAAAKQKAQEVLAQLQANPEQFQVLAAEHSSCPSGKEGGHLGQFGQGQMVPEFDQAVFSNPANTLISDLVKTQFGYHIILVGDKSEGGTVAFETAKERIAHYLHESAWHQQVQQYLGGLFASADIQGIEIKGA